MVNSPKKVLYIAHSSRIAGAENALYTLLKYIDREKFEPIVILPEEGPMFDLIKKLNMHTIILPLKWWIADKEAYYYETTEELIERSKRIASIIESEKIDIVHTNTSVIIEGALAARMTNRPHIWHIHEILDNHPTLALYLPIYITNMMIGLLSDVVVAVSNKVKNCLYGIDPSIIRVIYNGIDIKPIDKNKSIRHELNIPAEIHLISTIGSVVREKGYDALIETAALILSNRNDVVFLAIGEKGGLYEKLNKKIHKLNIEKNFYFLGFRNDVPEIICESDMVVVSSITESFSLSTVEAMAYGKPVIATCCGGVEEIIVNGETGYLVPVKDASQIADAILQLLDNKEKRLSMGRKSEARFHGLYEAERYVKELEQLYNSIGEKKALSAHENLIMDSLIEVFSDVRNSRSKDAHLNAILNSRSWKITAPFRWLSSVLKGRV